MKICLLSDMIRDVFKNFSFLPVSSCEVPSNINMSTTTALLTTNIAREQGLGTEHHVLHAVGLDGEAENQKQYDYCHEKFTNSKLSDVRMRV